jgi:hypothetical protein
MTRKRALWALSILAVMALATLIARNTYWEDVKVPTPLRGDARVNPFYAAQRFVERLGARTSWDRALGTPPPSNAVIVLSGWHWSIGRGRQTALQRWVESGGRLVVDNNLIDPNGEFEEWSGIVREYPKIDEPAASGARSSHEQAGCRPVYTSPEARSNLNLLCGFDESWLESKRTVAWAVRDTKHAQVMRVDIGRGSITVINASPLRYRQLFDGDNGRLIVAATELRHGDEVHFLSEDEYPGLLRLMWRRGAPVVAIGLALVGLLLWRSSVRFGPLASSPPLARRSLADQIRGSGRFALQYGREALHAAGLRALDEAARRRISHYSTMKLQERSAVLARATGFDREALFASAQLSSDRTVSEVQQTLALLEAARRQILQRHAPDDGTR